MNEEIPVLAPESSVNASVPVLKPAGGSDAGPDNIPVLQTAAVNPGKATSTPANDINIPVLDSGAIIQTQASAVHDPIPTLNPHSQAPPVRPQEVQPAASGADMEPEIFSEEMLAAIRQELTIRILASVQTTLNDALIIALHNVSNQVRESLQQHLEHELPEIIDEIIRQDTQGPD